MPLPAPGPTGQLSRMRPAPGSPRHGRRCPCSSTSSADRATGAARIAPFRACTLSPVNRQPFPRPAKGARTPTFPAGQHPYRTGQSVHFRTGGQPMPNQQIIGRCWVDGRPADRDQRTYRRRCAPQPRPGLITHRERNSQGNATPSADYEREANSRVARLSAQVIRSRGKRRRQPRAALASGLVSCRTSPTLPRVGSSVRLWAVALLTDAPHAVAQAGRADTERQVETAAHVLQCDVARPSTGSAPAGFV
jgi:hypothetical protein